MSLRTRIILFNAFVLALAFLAAGVAVAGFWAAFQPLRHAVKVENKAIELAELLRDRLDQEAASVTSTLASGAAESAYRSANQDFDTLLFRAALLAADDASRVALDAVRQAEREFNRVAERALMRRNEPGVALRILNDEVVPARDAAERALDRYLQLQQHLTRAAEQTAAERALRTTAVLVALLAFVGGTGGVLSLHLSRNLLERLSALAQATGKVAAGDRTVRITAPSRRGDELDHVGHAFNRMVLQLAQAEEAAREADDLKANFLAAISHDLRTPLTTVKGLLETLKRDDVEWDNETRQEFLEVAARETERLARLVTNLLDLSRLDAGAWPLDREAVDLRSLVQSLVGELSVPGGPLAQHQILVETAGTCHAFADELQVRRVLENLLTNAAKFSPAGSRIWITVSDRGADAMATVRVQDEGIGLPEAMLDRIFDRFYRGAATQHAVAGTGLGLAICRGIVEAHGGRIWCEAAPVGAAFAFSLPAVPRPELAEVVAPPRRLAAAGRTIDRPA